MYALEFSVSVVSAFALIKVTEIMNPSLLLIPLDLTKAVYFRNFSLTFLETLASIKMTISG